MRSCAGSMTLQWLHARFSGPYPFALTGSVMAVTVLVEKSGKRFGQRDYSNRTGRRKWYGQRAETLHARMKKAAPVARRRPFRCTV